MGINFLKGIVDGRSAVIVLGVLVFAVVGCIEHKRRGNKASEVITALPLFVLFSILLCRVLHWYCRSEQYDNLFSAITNYHIGGYVTSGILLAVALTVLLLRGVGMVKSVRDVFDSIAPAVMLGLAMMKWKSVFDNACRGKVVVRTQWLQRLPFAAATSAGEYRVAVFALQSLLFLAVGIMLLRMLRTDSKRAGDTALCFLSLYGAIQIVTDSMRYDASFMPFNGFVSFEQVFGAILLLVTMLVYNKWAVRNSAAKSRRVVSWIMFWLGVAGIGGFEYLVQRHGNWYMYCYPVMICFAVLALYAVKRMRDAGDTSKMCVVENNAL